MFNNISHQENENQNQNDTSEQSKKEIKKIPFTVASKIIKYLGINLTKEVKDLYIEYYKTKEIRDLNKWKDILCLWIRRLNIFKMAVLPKAICRFSVISIKVPMAFFCRNGKVDPHIHIQLQGSLPVP